LRSFTKEGNGFRVVPINFSTSGYSKENPKNDLGIFTPR
jgi:hypothetical protein